MDELTIHGLSRIPAQKRCLGKSFWVLLFTTGCAILTWYLFDSLIRFSKYPFATSVLYNLRTSLPFPSITICDTDVSRYEPFKEDPFPKSCSTDDLANASDAFRHGCKLFIAGFHEGCVYDSGKRCNFPGDFSREKHWNFCYTFNKNGSLRQSMPDKLYGFEVIMMKNASDLRALDAATTLPLRLTHLRRGLALHLHSPHFGIGFNTMDFIYLLPGHYTEVFVKKVVKNRLQFPYPTNCARETDARSIVDGNNSVQTCMRSCFFLRVYEQCGDVQPEGRVFMSYDKFPKRPKTENLTNCFRDVYKSTDSLNCECPLPCHEEEFHTEVRQTPILITSTPPKMDSSLANTLNVSEKEISLKFYQENIVILNVFYESFLVELVNESPLYDFASLLGNVGGLMGLLIGASAISLVELLWLMIGSVAKRMREKIWPRDSRETENENNNHSP